MEFRCIYPADDSTDFLMPIYNMLEQINIDNCFRIQTDEDRAHVLESILKSNFNTIIIFLGHGTAQYLQLKENTEFINKDNFSILENKKLFFISCYSSSFIESNKSGTIIPEYIGFGNIPSEDSDLIPLIGDVYDINTLEEIAIKSNDVLVEIIKNALGDTFTKNKDLKYLYKRIRFYFNRKIADILINKGLSWHKELSCLLFGIKDDMVIVHS